MMLLPRNLPSKSNSKPWNKWDVVGPSNVSPLKSNEPIFILFLKVIWPIYKLFSGRIKTRGSQNKHSQGLRGLLDSDCIGWKEKEWQHFVGSCYDHICCLVNLLPDISRLKAENGKRAAFLDPPDAGCRSYRRAFPRPKIFCPTSMNFLEVGIFFEATIPAVSLHCSSREGVDHDRYNG